MDAPKFIASDIDGTFLNPDHRVVPRNRDVVTRAVEDGAKFALATGRPHRWIQPVLEQIPLRPLCVTSNGAVVYDMTASSPVSISRDSSFLLTITALPMITSPCSCVL